MEKKISYIDFIEMLTGELIANPNYQDLNVEDITNDDSFIKEAKQQFINGKSIDSILFFYKYKDI